MAAVDNTETVLYHFLRALSVKVSRSTVHRLVDTPVGNSMRGISDALDALHIKNEVYQLPPTAEFFSQLEAPFITMQQTGQNPFCIVTKNADTIVESYGANGKHTTSTDDFLKHWTGNTLLSEVTEETPEESLCIWKDAWFYLLKYKVIIAFLVLLILGLVNIILQETSTLTFYYLCTLAFGCIVSLGILYKERFNNRFMEQLCHIGKVVDCNEVIRSKGAAVAGVRLGELSLFYFVSLFLFCTICPANFYALSILCNIIALCFTIYSIIYQGFIIHKGCMFCILVNLTVGVMTIELYLLKDRFAFCISLHTLYIFIAIGSICLILGIVFNSYRITSKEKLLQEEHLLSLLKPVVFQKLLELEPQIKKDISIGNVAISNSQQGGKHLLIVTNPNCSYCAKVHPYIKELSTKIPISLILLFNDKVGKEVSEIILTAYIQEGWDRAMQLLELWFEKHTMAKNYYYRTTDTAKEMLQKQIMYCRKQNISQTPSTIINGYYVPKIYPLSILKYVLT